MTRTPRWLRGGQSPPPPPNLPEVPPGDELRSGMDTARQRIAGRVPMEVIAGVARIGDQIAALLTQPGRLTPSSEEHYIVHRIVDDYLPSALEAYLNLQREYADTEVISEQHTAKDVLLDQLQLLSDRLAEAVDASRGGDTTTLLANQRFLQERFGGGSDSLRLDTGP